MPYLVGSFSITEISLFPGRKLSDETEAARSTDIYTRGKRRKNNVINDKKRRVASVRRRGGVGGGLSANRVCDAATGDGS